MNSSSMMIDDIRNGADYHVRVRGTKYLWGSAGITQDITFSRALVFHIHNHLFGEAITFGTRLSSGDQKNIGTLQPGECISIPLQDISGVFAQCDLESIVACIIK